MLLKDYEGVRQSATDALEQFAIALEKNKDATAIPDLEMVLVALRATNFSEERTRVRQAVEALKAIEKVH